MRAFLTGEALASYKFAENIRRMVKMTDKAFRIDNVNHPKHYTANASGVECIDVVESMDFCIGNAIKYLWRAGLKDPQKLDEDLAKARWYIDRKISQLEKDNV